MTRYVAATVTLATLIVANPAVAGSYTTAATCEYTTTPLFSWAVCTIASMWTAGLG